MSNAHKNGKPGRLGLQPWQDEPRPKVPWYVYAIVVVMIAIVSSEIGLFLLGAL